MPRGDRTGPMGMGPMTGRAAGYCAGNAVPGFMNAPGGRRFGGGGGRGGRGRRDWFYATCLTGWQRAAHLVSQVRRIDRNDHSHCHFGRLRCRPEGWKNL